MPFLWGRVTLRKDVVSWSTSWDEIPTLLNRGSSWAKENRAMENNTFCRLGTGKPSFSSSGFPLSYLPHAQGYCQSQWRFQGFVRVCSTSYLLFPPSPTAFRKGFSSQTHNLLTELRSFNLPYPDWSCPVAKTSSHDPGQPAVFSQARGDVPGDNHQTCLSLGTVLFCASTKVGCNKNCNVFSLSSVLCQTAAQISLRWAMRQADRPQDLCLYFGQYISLPSSSSMSVQAHTHTHPPDDSFASGSEVDPRMYVLQTIWNQSKV